MKNQISCVMPCWTLNESVHQMTVNALDSIQDTPIIIVDNASPMGGGYLRSKADIYVRNKENLGFAKAVNQGIKLAQTRYVAIVSTDVRVSPNWKEVALQIFAHSEVSSCSFRMTNYDVPLVYGSSTALTGKERWCTAAFFVLDKEKGFYFDEDFFNSYEDWDIFTRMRKAGYQTAYTDKACYQHAHSFTQQFVGFSGSEKNKEIFKRKHGKYAEELFAEMYSEQVTIEYWKGFEV